jgi:hypothetical protein
MTRLRYEKMHGWRIISFLESFQLFGNLTGWEEYEQFSRKLREIHSPKFSKCVRTEQEIRGLGCFPAQLNIPTGGKENPPIQPTHPTQLYNP